MQASLDTIEAEALKLSPEDRIVLADHLLASVVGDSDVDEAWAVEVTRRIAEVEAGRMQLVPADQAVARARLALG